jgi:hypothetical protein
MGFPIPTIGPSPESRCRGRSTILGRCAIVREGDHFHGGAFAPSSSALAKASRNGLPGSRAREVRIWEVSDRALAELRATRKERPPRLRARQISVRNTASIMIGPLSPVVGDYHIRETLPPGARTIPSGTPWLTAPCRSQIRQLAPRRRPYVSTTLRLSRFPQGDRVGQR